MIPLPKGPAVSFNQAQSLTYGVLRPSWYQNRGFPLPPSPTNGPARSRVVPEGHTLAAFSGSFGGVARTDWLTCHLLAQKQNLFGFRLKQNALRHSLDLNFGNMCPLFGGFFMEDQKDILEGPPKKGRATPFPWPALRMVRRKGGSQ